MRVKQGVKAIKDGYVCEVCSQPIPKGDIYQWAKPFRGPKRKRHMTCPTWKASELETGSMGPARAAQEEAEEALSALDLDTYANPDNVWDAKAFIEDVGNILSECSSQAEESQSMLEESFDNMPEGLQQGDTGQQLEERKDAVESWRDELESWSYSGADEPDLENETIEEWAEAVIEEAREVVQGLDV